MSLSLFELKFLSHRDIGVSLGASGLGIIIVGILQTEETSFGLLGSVLLLIGVTIFFGNISDA